MARARGKTITIIASVGVAAVAALTLAFWRDIAAYRYILDFREDPERLLDFAAKAEDSIPGYAVQKFLETGEGKRALFRLFLKSQQETLDRGKGRDRADPSNS